MKKILLYFVFLISLSSFSCESFDCSASGIYTYPDKETISLNELIIIEGYANSQKIVKNLSHRKVFLIAKNDKVVLNFKTTNVGEMSLTQSLFIPSRDLKPNTTYYLKFENQTKEETRLLKKWNRKTEKNEEINFKTNKKRTDQNNYRDIEYHFKDTNFTLFGCGPAVYANFKVSGFGNTIILHKVEVLNLKNQKNRTYYLYSFKSEISIGHGMCSGAFKFNGGDKYKVRFTPISSSGKEKKTSNWISFENPYKNVKNRW